MGKADVFTGMSLTEKLIWLKKFSNGGSTPTYEDRTASGNPVIITTNFAQNAKALSASFSPKQNLNGYDHPWAGGAGKNLIGSGNLVSGKTIDSNGAIVNYANRLATVDPIMIDSTKSYVFSTTSTDVLLMYAVFNGSALVRRITGVVSGTTLDVSGGDRIFISLYTYRSVSVEEPLTWEVGGWYYDGNTSKYVKWETDTRLRTTFVPNRTGKAIIKKPTNQSYSVTVYSASRKFLITMTNTQYERDFDIIANDQIYFNVAPKSGDPMTTLEEVSTLECYLTHDEWDYRLVAPESEKVQFEVGSTPTAYEPYENICPITGIDSIDVVANSVTHEFDLGRTVYGGTLTVNSDGSGTLTVDRASVDFGTLTWTMHMVGGFYATPPGCIVNDLGAVCDTLAYKPEYNAAAAATMFNNLSNCQFAWYSNIRRFFVKDATCETVTALVEKYTGATLVYTLATPTTYALSAEQIALLEGQNVIATDGDNLSVTYQVKV